MIKQERDVTGLLQKSSQEVLDTQEFQSLYSTEKGSNMVKDVQTRYVKKVGT